MKVYIGPYKNWFGPHQLANLLCFWVKRKKFTDEFGHDYYDRPEWVFKLGEWFAYGKWQGIKEIYKKDDDLFKDRDEKETLLYKFLLWIDRKRERKIYVKIDRYDTWSMDHTLAVIILPMLKQLQKTKHGSHVVDLEDVPLELRYTNTEEYEDQACFEFYREHDVKEGEADIHARWDWVLNEMIWAFEQLNADEGDGFKFFSSESGKWDSEGYENHNNRLNNGLRLFGKYFRGLWD